MKKLVFLGAAVILAAIFGYNYVAREPITLDRQIKGGIIVLQDKLELSLSDIKKAASSNPYDYIKNNPAYDSIVNKGPGVLPELREKIANSPQNGLSEYVLAIAAEEIAKVDLKGSDFGWANAKEWVSAWDKYLETLPQKVKQISDSTATVEVKINDLEKLGVPAIPYIMDEVQKGRNELVPALDKLLRDNGLVDYNRDWTSDVDKWIKDNRAGFDGLRKMVEDVSVGH